MLQKHPANTQRVKEEVGKTNPTFLTSACCAQQDFHSGGTTTAKMAGLPFYLLKLFLTFFFSCLSCVLTGDLISAGKWKRFNFYYCNHYRYASSVMQNWMNLRCTPKAEFSSLAFLPALLNPSISEFSIFLDVQVPKRPFWSADWNLLCRAICQKRKLPFKANHLKEKCRSS